MENNPSVIKFNGADRIPKIGLTIKNKSESASPPKTYVINPSEIFNPDST